jgi:hypothetical protein
MRGIVRAVVMLHRVRQQYFCQVFEWLEVSRQW